MFTIKITSPRGNPPVPLLDFIRDVMRQHARDFTYAVQERLRENLSGRILRRKTGDLLESWMGEPREQKTEDKINYTMGSDKVYARIHEFGGEIRALNNPHKYLVFRTDDGQWHSVESVVIPARRYVSDAFERTAADEARIFRMALETSKRRVKGNAV